MKCKICNNNSFTTLCTICSNLTQFSKLRNDEFIAVSALISLHKTNTFTNIDTKKPRFSRKNPFLHMNVPNKQDSHSKPRKNLFNRVGEKWDANEDELLFQKVQEFGINDWNTIAKFVVGRTAEGCRSRYRSKFLNIPRNKRSRNNEYFNDNKKEFIGKENLDPNLSTTLNTNHFNKKIKFDNIIKNNYCSECNDPQKLVLFCSCCDTPFCLECAVSNNMLLNPSISGSNNSINNVCFCNACLIKRYSSDLSRVLKLSRTRQAFVVDNDKSTLSLKPVILVYAFNNFEIVILKSNDCDYKLLC